MKQVRNFGPDLIVVHQISDFLSFADIRALQEATGARVAWNLVDMEHLTGGCHYAWECRGFERACGACPALPMRPAEDLSRRTMRDKARAIDGMDLVVVAGSASLERQARESSLFGPRPIAKVLIGVDPSDFPVTNAAEARRQLGVAHEGPILFFGAQRLTDARKGMQVLLDALVLLRQWRSGAPMPLLLVAGDAANLRNLDELGYPVCQLGFLDSRRLALAYAAADFFICPSIEDSGPMMVNEAMMAGTPVVAFDIGVIPDLVISGETGIVVERKTAEAMARALYDALTWGADRIKASRAACRQLAHSRITLERQAEDFLGIMPR